MAASNRIRQGVRALLAFSQPVDFDLAASYLTDAQMDHFRQMSRTVQLHSLNVLRDILKQETRTPQDLAVAALLHDVGKARYHLAVWQKTLVVLVRKFAPNLYARWSAAETLTYWRAPFVVAEYHPRWSAAVLRETGASERAIWLAEHHQDTAAQWREHPHYALLVRLQRADDLN